MKTTLYLAVCLGIFLRYVGFAQVTSTQSQRRTVSAPITLGSEFSRLKLAHNGPDFVRQEVLDTNMLRLIGAAGGLTDQDLTTVQIEAETEDRWVWIHQVGPSEKAFAVLSEQLRIYVREREGGHTKSFLMTALTNRMAMLTASDWDLRVIATNKPFVPTLLLLKESSHTVTNKAGNLIGRSVTVTITNGRAATNQAIQVQQKDEVSRRVSYTVVDGEVAWRYLVSFKADGSLDFIHDRRFDPKEIDPKYKATIKSIEHEVSDEMKRDGSYGELGSVHSFWHLKKAKLKAKGIEWKSPSELNPETIYD